MNRRTNESVGVSGLVSNFMIKGDILFYCRRPGLWFSKSKLLRTVRTTMLSSTHTHTHREREREREREMHRCTTGLRNIAWVRANTLSLSLSVDLTSRLFVQFCRMQLHNGLKKMWWCSVGVMSSIYLSDGGFPVQYCIQTGRSCQRLNVCLHKKGGHKEGAVERRTCDGPSNNLLFKKLTYRQYYSPPYWRCCAFLECFGRIVEIQGLCFKPNIPLQHERTSW